jgi:DNA-binding NtrC family response regulator
MSPNSSSESRTKPVVVIIDDDVDMLDLLEDFLMTKTLRCERFSDPLGALAWFQSKSIRHELDHVECIISDIQMPGLNGNELLASLLKMHLSIPVVLATAFGSVDSALQSIRQGAFDYIVKPFKLHDLELTIGRARRLREVQRDNDRLRRTLTDGGEFAGIIGRSPQMIHLFSQIERVAPTNANVLITGESGTGKERVARAIHARSHAPGAPFVALNCSAIPESLLESELFGHAKGSFTGAHQSKPGLMRVAGQGTFFLDEVGDMSLALQAKLLRVIQERRFLPIGAVEDVPFEARLIAASHRNLAQGVTEGWFREDLFYRLNVVPINVPPLRERREDIPELASTFLSKACLLNNFEPKRLDASAKQHLARQRWRGNVRQLQNLMERVAILLPDPKVTADDLEQLMSPEDQNKKEDWFAKLMTLEELEKEYIGFILRQTHGRKEEAATLLGINRRTLYRKEREYGLVPAGAPCSDET